MDFDSDPALRRWPSKHWIVLVAGASLLTSIGLSLSSEHVLAFLTSFLLFIAAAAVAACVGIGLLVTRLVSPVRARSRGFADTCRFTVLVGTLALVQFPNVIAGKTIHSIQVEAAKRWCDSLGPRLEAWRAEKGSFPTELSMLGNELDPPSLCRTLLYRADSDGYTLDFSEGTWLSGWWYSSQSREWERYH